MEKIMYFVDPPTKRKESPKKPVVKSNKQGKQQKKGK